MGDNVYILDQDFNTVLVIDDYYSFLWVEKAFSAGEFVLELPYSYVNNPYLAFGYYVVSEEIVDERREIGLEGGVPFAIIETKEPSQSDGEYKFKISGGTGATVLKWRVTYTPWTIEATDSVSDFFGAILNLTFGGGAINSRRINNLYEDFSGISGIAAGVPLSWDPVDVYTIFADLCWTLGLGFDVLLDVPNSRFLVVVYLGEDRSYDQSANPWVVFGESYGNILSSSSYESSEGSKNVCYVISDQTDTQMMYYGAEPTGVNRRETVITESVTDPMTEPELQLVLAQRGLTTLDESKPKGVFEGEVDVNGVFVVNKDFFLGDIVSILDGQSHHRALVVELIRSLSIEGRKRFISFDYDI